jgi:hypothetical protein
MRPRLYREREIGETPGYSITTPRRRAGAADGHTPFPDAQVGENNSPIRFAFGKMTTSLPDVSVLNH